MLPLLKILGLFARYIFAVSTICYLCVTCVLSVCYLYVTCVVTICYLCIFSGAEYENSVCAKQQSVESQHRAK